MPYRKKYTRKRPRRVNRRRGMRRRRNYRARIATTGITRVVNMGLGLPAKLRVKLTFDSGTITYTTGGAGNQQTYAANSLFDPVVALGGTQPRFFDQYAALYNVYNVAACLVQVQGQIVNSSAATSTGEIFLQWAPAGISLFGDHSSLDEYKQFRGRLVNSEKPFYLRKYLKISDIEGVRPQHVQDDDLYSALVTANPSRVPQIGVTSFSFDDITTVSWAVRTKITYYATFYNLKNVTSS